MANAKNIGESTQSSRRMEQSISRARCKKSLCDLRIFEASSTFRSEWTRANALGTSQSCIYGLHSNSTASYNRRGNPTIDFPMREPNDDVKRPSRHRAGLSRNGSCLRYRTPPEPRQNFAWTIIGDRLAAHRPLLQNEIACLHQTLSVEPALKRPIAQDIA
jgi:hypothetical protein